MILEGRIRSKSWALPGVIQKSNNCTTPPKKSYQINLVLPIRLHSFVSSSFILLSIPSSTPPAIIHPDIHHHPPFPRSIHWFSLPSIHPSIHLLLILPSLHTSIHHPSINLDWAWSWCHCPLGSKHMTQVPCKYSLWQQLLVTISATTTQKRGEGGNRNKSIKPNKMTPKCSLS